MSATMARQGGRVQLEQSDMRLALSMAKMAKEGFSCSAIEETKYLIKKPRAEVREEKKRGVEFPGHKKVKAAIQRHLAIVLATGPGNPPAVRFLAGGSVRFGSLPGQKPEPRCLGGFVTRTGP